MNPKHLGPQSPGRGFRFRRWQRIVLISLAVLGVVWTGVLIAIWPFSRKAVISALQKQSEREVHIRTFHSTFLPLGYVAEDLRFDNRDLGKAQSSFTIRKLTVVARYSDLFFMRKRVKHIMISGLHLVVPAEPPSSTVRIEKASGNGEGQPRFSEIAEIQFDDAVVDFLSAEKGSDPLRLTFQNVVFNGVSQTRPASFRLEMVTSEPRGVIHSTGMIGPWNWKDTGDSSLSGNFSFERGDLSVFEGIGGYLKAAGKFSGPLRRVICHGSLEVPDFHLSGSTHQVPLSNAFRALVNGLNGDTTLEYVHSQLGGTRLESHGTIMQDPQRAGKDSSVEFTVNDGRIEDLLLLFTKDPQPSMTGTVNLRADAELPAGPTAFLQKLKLQGDFGIGDSRFTKVQTQAPINHLSKSAEGLSKTEEKDDKRVVLSNLKGHVSAKNGIAVLSSIRAGVPGAHAMLSGTYNLVNSTLNLKGVLTTTGEISQTTNGVKSAMLKVLTPFLKKHSVTIVPFTITGLARDPSFALDLKAKRRE